MFAVQPCTSSRPSRVLVNGAREALTRAERSEELVSCRRQNLTLLSIFDRGIDSSLGVRTSKNAAELVQ